MNNKKFSIGEFSERTGIPIPTLHYYDEIGILQPEKILLQGIAFTIIKILLHYKKLLV